MAVLIPLVLDNKQVLRGLKQIEKGFDSVEKDVSKVQKKFNTLNLKNLGRSGLTAIATGFSNLAAAAGRFATVAAASFLDVNSMLEQMEIMMTTATGSLEGGQKALEDMLMLSTKAPFSIDSLANSFVKLKTAGIDPMNGTLQVLVDSVAAFGGSSEQLRLVSIAMQQMAGKGVISMEELRRQFGEQVPTAMRAMARELKMSVFDMLDLIGKGGLTSDRGIPALIEGLRKLHTGAAEKRMESFEGAIIGLRNQWIRLMKSIGDGEGAFDTITGAINAAASGLENLRLAASNSEVLQKMSENIAGVFEKLSEPAMFEIMARNVMELSSAVIGATKGMVDGVAWLIATFDQLYGRVSEYRSRMAGLDVDSINADNYLQVREHLVEITKLQKELHDVPMSQMFGTMDELLERFDKDTAEKIARLLEHKAKFDVAMGRDIPMGKVGTVYFEAQMDALNAKWGQVTDEMVDEVDYMVGEWEGKFSEFDMEGILVEKAESSAQAMVDAFADKMPDIQKSIEKINKDIAKQQADLRKILREGDLAVSNLEVGNLSDSDAWRSRVEQIKEYGQKAQAAFKAGNLAEYNELLREQRGLIDALDTGGIKEKFDIPDSAIKKQKDLVNYWLKMMQQQTSFHAKRQYLQKAKDAQAEIRRLQKQQEEGEREVISAEEQRIIKIDLLRESVEKLAAAKKAEITALEDKKDNFEGQIKAAKSLETKLNDQKTLVNGPLTLVWDEFTKSWMYASQQRQAELDREMRKYQQYIDLVKFPVGAGSSSDFSGDINRYKGGSVSANSPYIVGEKGPELFVPKSNGDIVPNDKISGGNSTEVYFNFGKRRVGPFYSSNKMAKQVLREIEEMQGALS